MPEGRGDFDFAADFGFDIFQHGKRIVRTGQQAGAGSSQRAPRLGGGHPPCAAVKQFYTVLTFQPPDMLADGRRGHAQRGSGGVHAAVFEDGGENKQGFDVLHSSMMRPSESLVLTKSKRFQTAFYFYCLV